MVFNDGIYLVIDEWLFIADRAVSYTHLDVYKRQRKQVGIDPSLHLRFCEFRVIGLLANEGRKAAEPYIEETDRFYRQHPESSTPEAWFGYKIMCCRILGDLKGNIAYVDSLMDYQHSLGLCYPYNHYMKGELQEQLGDRCV